MHTVFLRYSLLGSREKKSKKWMRLERHNDEALCLMSHRLPWFWTDCIATWTKKSPQSILLWCKSTWCKIKGKMQIPFGDGKIICSALWSSFQKLLDGLPWHFWFPAMNPNDFGESGLPLTFLETYEIHRINSFNFSSNVNIGWNFQLVWLW